MGKTKKNYSNKNHKHGDSTYECIGKFLTMKGNWKDSFIEFVDTENNAEELLNTLLNESNQFISDHGSNTLIKRCKELQTILESKMTAEKKHIYSNLLIESIDLKTDSAEMTKSERLEFDTKTGKQITNPLSNLIIEELDVADYS